MFLPIYEDKMLFNVFLFCLPWLKKLLRLKIAHFLALEGFLREADIMGWDDHILGRVAIQCLLHLLTLSLHILNRVEDLFIFV